MARSRQTMPKPATAHRSAAAQCRAPATASGARLVAQARRLAAWMPAQAQGLEDEEPLQGQGLEEEELLQGQGLDDEELLQGQELDDEEPLQAKAAEGGLPPALQAGIAQLSDEDLSDVQVHAGSARPAELGALAYAQGNDIHLGPGQDRHLPHEAWHLVQQRQGRVRPTAQAAGMPVNDDPALEHEADVMGARAADPALQR